MDGLRPMSRCQTCCPDVNLPLCQNALAISLEGLGIGPLNDRQQQAIIRGETKPFGNTRRCFKPGLILGGHVQKRDRIMISGKLTNDESQAVTVVCKDRPPGVRPLQNRLARTQFDHHQMAAVFPGQQPAIPAEG